MSTDRTGIAYSAFSGIGPINTSFNRVPAFALPVRIINLAHIGLNSTKIIYGDELTWGDMDDLDIEIGENETLLYSKIQAGWRYEWNVGQKKLTVTTETNQVTVHRNIHCFEDLMISWEIVESHNFEIIFDASIEPPAFLVGEKSRRRGMDMQQVQWGENDRYLISPEHYVHEQIVMIEVKDRSGMPTPPIPIKLQSHIFNREPLLSAAQLLEMTSDYDVNILLTALAGELITNRVRRNLASEGVPVGLLLMVQYFASMSATFPNSYPWLLWKLWQWQWNYVKPPEPKPDDDNSSKDRIYDKVFDLSPWWG